MYSFALWWQNPGFTQFYFKCLFILYEYIQLVSHLKHEVCYWLKRKFLSEIYSATLAIRIRIDEERDLLKQKSLCRPLHCNCNFTKKRLWSRCFPVYFAKFWRLFFTEHLYATASGPFETNLNLEAATGGVL